MPLDRAHITKASALMLPFYIVTDAIYGVMFILDPGSRFGHAPSLAIARELLPLDVWGVMWLTLACFMVGAWGSRRRDAMIGALWVSLITWLLWGFTTAAAVFTQPLVTPLAGWPGLTLAVAQLASVRSLRTKEA